LHKAWKPKPVDFLFLVWDSVW